MQVNSSVSVETVDDSLLAGLSDTYGDRVEKVLHSLNFMGSRYYFRLNSLVSDPVAVLDEIRS
ncbi:MAG TPA: hypothetical protein VIK88_03515, partial [Candidatus Bathyarchaeia archaeon]